ncbi:MAG: amylosucrase [Clostridiales bacterium]|nr:amylosucrase [Clostridiales bacterium]
MNDTLEQRLRESFDELKWLYCELYNNDMGAFEYFVGMLRRCAGQRKQALRDLDRARLENPAWYRSNKLMGMMMYTNAFAGTLNGVRENLPYIEECGVNYLHLMPLLKTVRGRSDGGYAVADFRAVQPELGTMEELEALTDECHERGICLCLDFVMNHTSEDHPWAKAARAGDPVARSRYFFFDNREIPDAYDSTVPQVFPTTAPGNFTFLPDCGKHVMTCFYPYQWDLNYANPMVFNDMTENLLFLANRGIDVVRLDAIPYIWKQLGTDCRNLPQVHTLARMLHLACYIVCPGVLLLGEVVMEPQKLAPYFGTPEKPECDILYNATTMCTTWHTLATRDVRLLRYQTEKVCALPKTYLFQNYLRCHDDIGWGLDFSWLGQMGFGEVPHKKYLNDWFTGRFPSSPSRGELYNDDPRLGDARMCGTTASLCGLETAKTPQEETLAVQCDVMLHAWIFAQSGIPVIYSGDEIGQLNDYTYHDDPERRDDSRYLHRGQFDWALAQTRNDPDTPAGKIFSSLRRLETLRSKHDVFSAAADVTVLDTGSDNVIGIRRVLEDEALTAVFNFSENPREIINPAPGAADLYTGVKQNGETLKLPGYGFVWLCESSGDGI